MEFYLSAILSADTEDALDRIIEEAAYDDRLTNKEYEALYNRAVEKARISK
jgi:hypothetical protein